MSLKMLLASALLLGSTAVAAHSFQAGDLDIAHPWARPLPPVAKVGVAYFTVTNNGDADDVLLRAESPISDTVEIHTHIKEGDLMKMRQLGDLTIAAHSAQKLAPGGVHLMLMGLKEVPAEGTKFPVTLHFKEAGKVDIEVAVDADPTAAEHGSHDDNAHAHSGH